MWAMLGSVLQWVMGGLIAKWVIGLGIGIVTFVGVNELLAVVLEDIEDKITGLPSEIFTALVVMKVGVALSILGSAFSIRLTLGLLQSGASRLKVS